MEIETRYLKRVFETIQDDSFYNNLGLDNRNIEAIKAKEITKTYLETPFEGGRHQRRIDMITIL